MIGRIWAQVTAPKTRFTEGNIQNSEQANAADRVHEMQDLVDRIGHEMSGINEHANDGNKGNPDSVFGTVTTRNAKGYDERFQGLCEFEHTEAHAVSRLDVDYVTYDKKGDHKEICVKSYCTGTPAAGDLGPNTLVTEEWAISDGPKASYTKFEYWTDL